VTFSGARSSAQETRKGNEHRRRAVKKVKHRGKTTTLLTLRNCGKRGFGLGSAKHVKQQLRKREEICQTEDAVKRKSNRYRVDVRMNANLQVGTTDDLGTGVTGSCKKKRGEVDRKRPIQNEHVHVGTRHGAALCGSAKINHKDVQMELTRPSKNMRAREKSTTTKRKNLSNAFKFVGERRSTGAVAVSVKIQL